MSHWAKRIFVAALALIVAIGIADVFLERNARRIATDGGKYGDFHQMAAEELESNIRKHLPLGSSRTSVETFLRNQKLKFSHEDKSNTVSAMANYLNGSSWLITKELLVNFTFDNEDKLASITSRVELTGP